MTSPAWAADGPLITPKMFAVAAGLVCTVALIWLFGWLGRQVDELFPGDDE